MPEGDTIYRAAESIRKWVGGRTVTAARTKVRGLQLERVVGKTIEAVEPRAKHMLIRFNNGLSLHTHMKMTGSWHVYTKGDRWQRPEWQAKIVLECDDRVAVCFNAPVVEMLTPSDEKYHAPLNGLGPDVLQPATFDLAEVRRRASLRPPDYEVGVLLLDQQVVGGIGNIYRCETLFLERLHPWTGQSQLSPQRFDRMINTAVKLMGKNVGPGGGTRNFGNGDGNPWVYGRTGRPCRVCGVAIRTDRMGAQAREIHWCPNCQKAVDALG